MTARIDAVQQTLNVLRKYYADRDGKSHPLNETQVVVYLEGLARFDASALEAAARAHMKASPFFPRLSQLLDLLEGDIDPTVQAHLAWTTVERALRQAGAYRGATFVDGAIGETVRHVFGSWPAACRFDTDSPGWAIRRQTFVALYPTVSKQSDGAPVTLAGQDAKQAPLVVAHIDGLPEPRVALAADRPLSHADANALLGDIQVRAATKTQLDPKE